MEAEETARYRRTLETLRATIEEEYASMAASAEPVSPDNAIGRLTRQDALQTQQMTLELRRRNRRRLGLVGRALARIESGTFGLCERCGDEISPARLKVRPESPLCIACAGGGRRP